MIFQRRKRLSWPAGTLYQRRSDYSLSRIGSYFKAASIAIGLALNVVLVIAASHGSLSMAQRLRR
jgi:hypothetical protein